MCVWVIECVFGLWCCLHVGNSVCISSGYACVWLIVYMGGWCTRGRMCGVRRDRVNVDGAHVARCVV